MEGSLRLQRTPWTKVELRGVSRSNVVVYSVRLCIHNHALYLGTDLMEVCDISHSCNVIIAFLLSTPREHAHAISLRSTPIGVYSCYANYGYPTYTTDVFIQMRPSVYHVYWPSGIAEQYGSRLLLFMYVLEG